MLIIEELLVLTVPILYEIERMPTGLRRSTFKAIIVTGAGRAFCAGADLSSGGKTFNSDARLTETAASIRMAAGV